MSYEFDGDKYKKASSHQKEWGSRILSELKLSGSEAILDIGCGDGYLTQKLSGLVPQGYALGIDASKGMIETAKKSESGNLSFRIEDINKIQFKNEFDVIFSNATLHWIKNHKKLLSNCFRALKNNGYIRFNFAGQGNCSFFYKVIKEVLTLKDYQKYFKNFEWPWYMPDINDYKKLVINSSFRNIQIWEENADRYFPDEASLIKWIDQPSIVPFISLVQEKDKEKFRETVISKMTHETEQDNGTYFETFRRINVLAYKN